MKTATKIFTLLFLVAPLIISAQTWQVVGEGGFSDGSSKCQRMALDGLTPYVAYSDETNDHLISVKRFNGTEWESVGGEAFGEEVDELDFAIQNSKFYIVYSTGSNISVMTLEDNAWVYVGDSPLDLGRDVSLSMWEGAPYIAYYDEDVDGGTGQSSISVQKLTGSGWEYLGEEGFVPSFLPSVVDFEVDGSKAYVVYRDWSTLGATVMKFEDEEWSFLGAEGFSGGTHDSRNALAIYNNEPYVASWNSEAQGVVYKFEGTEWQQVGAPITTGTGRSLTMRTSPLNELHIAFRDSDEGDKAQVKKLSGSDWEEVGDVISLLSTTYLSLAFNTNGQAYLAYQDDWYIRKTTVMTYDFTSGLNNELSSEQIRLYPNPCNDHMQISNNGENPVVYFKIYDHRGRLISGEKSTIAPGASVEFETSSLSNGMYYLQLQTENQTVTYKFIKQ